MFPKVDHALFSTPKVHVLKRALFPNLMPVDEVTFSAVSRRDYGYNQPLRIPRKMIGGINSVWKQFVVLDHKYHLEKKTTTHFKYRKNIMKMKYHLHGLLMKIFFKYLIFNIYISYKIHYAFF